MNIRKLIALLLTLALLAALTACGGGTAGDSAADSVVGDSVADSVGGGDPVDSTPVDSTDDPVVSDSTGDPVDDRDDVRLAVMSGPTGVGAAKLLSDADNGVSINDYQYTIAADNAEVMAGLISAEPTFDIAAVASNVAVNLYNKTDGGVRIIALGTLGVLHILEGGGTSTLNSVADLEGETIYSAGQGANPEYILRHLLTQNGLDPDEDVEIVFAEASEIQAKLLAGEIKYAMLPVPAATATIIKGAGEVRAAIDVTEAWGELIDGSQLIMTAVVARTEFIEENPEAVKAFLEEYEASINYVNENVDEAAELIAGYGITPNAAIAKQAIPQCHLVYIDGADMAPAISDYFVLLYEVNPSAVGGMLPDDAIYYEP